MKKSETQPPSVARCRALTDESPSASQLFLAQSISVPFFRGMAPPAATPPPGVPNPLDARAVACIERVHELRKESLATGTSPLPDYDDVPVRSPTRSHLETLETRATAAFVSSSHLTRRRKGSGDASESRPPLTGTPNPPFLSRRVPRRLRRRPACARGSDPVASGSAPS